MEKKKTINKRKSNTTKKTVKKTTKKIVEKTNKKVEDKTNKKTLVYAILLIIGIVLSTIFISYSLLKYQKQGQSITTITAGSITFHYKEIDGMGHGISITDAVPVSSNDDAKSMNKSFNFEITSNTVEKVTVPYTVTARLDNDADEVMGDIVDLYLTEVNGNSENPTDLFSSTLPKYNELEQYDKINNYIEKVIYNGEVPANTANYKKNFRLRMWIDEAANYNKQCSINPSENDTQAKCTTANGTWDYQYNNKEFSVTINVYAKGSKMTTEQQETLADTSISGISGNNTQATAEGNNEYILVLPAGTTSTDVNINTTNPRATVTVQRVDSFGMIIKESKIKRIASVNVHDLVEGSNYFIVTVKSQDQTETKQYNLIVVVESVEGNLKSKILADYPLKTGTVNLKDIYPNIAYYDDTNFSGEENIKMNKQYHYYTYSDSYTYDETNNKYTLTNPQVCRYNECYNDLIGKYIVNRGGKTTSTADNATNISSIYLVIEPTTLSSIKTITGSSGSFNGYGSATAKETYYTYSDSYTYDKYAKKFTLTDPQVCKYSECYQTLKNKYIVSIDGKTAETLETATDLSTIYKVTENATLENLTYKVSTTKAVRATDSGLYKTTVTNGFGGKTGAAETYYFRGDVRDNVVRFAGMLWRIVRINEDGTIRLILDYNPTFSSAYNKNLDSYTYMYYSNSTMKTSVENWYKTNITDEGYGDSVATGDYFCEAARVTGTTLSMNNGNADMTLYSSYTPDLKCVKDGNNKQYVNGNVGLMTYDEVILAGGYVTQNKSYYLYRRANGQYNDYYWWTMSPFGYSSKARIWFVSTDGSLPVSVITNCTYRPVINLKSTVTAIRTYDKDIKASVYEIQ